MKDNLNEYNVTCYVTVAVTVRGVKASCAMHAAMSAATALAESIDSGYFAHMDSGADELEAVEIDGLDHEITLECDGGDLDGFLVETADGETAERLDKNGNPAAPEKEDE